MVTHYVSKASGKGRLGVVRASVHRSRRCFCGRNTSVRFFFVTIVFLKKIIVVNTLNLPMMGGYKPVLFIVVWILLLSTGSTRKCCDSKCTSKYCLLN